MVMGSLKTRLADSFSNINVSIPSVVSGLELVNSLGEGANKVSIKVSIESEHHATISLLYRENPE